MNKKFENFQYFESILIERIRKLFIKFYKNKHTNFSIKNSKKIRLLFFDFFKSENFKKEYLKLGHEIQSYFKIPKNLFVLQGIPTPRVFSPGDHGTSLHCDYWYGHGIKSRTVWIPLIGLNNKSTFEMVISDEENNRIISLIKNDNLLLEKINKVNIKTFPVLPKLGEAAIFSSNLLHKSTSNSSNKLRLSFDFRFGKKNDQTSNKNLNTWYQFKKGLLANMSINKKKDFIKYIIGGKKIETGAQHLLIESFAKINGIEISAQEAEIERFGYSMLKMHCKDIANKKGRFKGIVIASTSLLEKNILKDIVKNKIPVFACLEAKWI